MMDGDMLDFFNWDCGTIDREQLNGPLSLSTSILTTPTVTAPVDFLNQPKKQFFEFKDGAPKKKRKVSAAPKKQD